MKKALSFIIAIPVIILVLLTFKSQPPADGIPETIASVAAEEQPSENESYTISGIVQRGESLAAIFSKHGLDRSEMYDIYKSAKKEYNLSKITGGTIYSFEIDEHDNKIQRMQFGIDDLSFLDVIRKPDGFRSEKISVRPDIRIGSLFVDIEDSLIQSMPDSHKEYNRLALELSDIFAWDIDFSSDIQKGDTVKVIVEEWWIKDAFVGYGNILAAEFTNDGTTHFAYRFEDNGHADYYDAQGKSLKKALLRSPLKFKYISSYFSKSRFHPKLRIFRPHLGVDYAAPTGTPVSASGNATVKYAGYKGQMGKMVTLKHPGGYETFYGHLSRIPGEIRKGVKISQGDIIGYVGSTGLATGPHLDYRIRFNGRFVNPLKIDLPRGESVPDNLMAGFVRSVDGFNTMLASVSRPVVASFDKKKKTTG